MLQKYTRTNTNTNTNTLSTVHIYCSKCMWTLFSHSQISGSQHFRMRVEMFFHWPNNMCELLNVYAIAIFTFAFESMPIDKSMPTELATVLLASALFATIIKIKLRVTEYFYLKNRGSEKKMNTKQPNEIKIALLNIMDGKRNGNALSTLNPFTL